MTTKSVQPPAGSGSPLIRLGVLAASAVVVAALAAPAAELRTDDPARPAPQAEAVEPVDPVLPPTKPVSPAARPVHLGLARAEAAPPIDKRSGLILQVGNAADLAAKFAALDYTFDAVRDAKAVVPRVFLAAFPGDMKTLPSVDQRKALFFKTMLPLVLQVNEAVLHDRWRLLNLRDRLNTGDPLTEAERRWLAELAAAYRLDGDQLDELVLRVDAVPPSMALAQAAVESGWGTSRFAVEGNAVFGQITFADDGIVPENRRPGETHLFAAFDRLIDGVQSYVRNLNTHRAYADFRRRRADQRERGERLDGAALLDGLLRYSELGQNYVDYVRGVIRANDLERIDRARLAVPGSRLAIASTI